MPVFGCFSFSEPERKTPFASPFFESRFARLQYAGDERFNLAYFRPTGQWWEVAQLLPLQECLSRIEAGGLFTP